MKRAGTWWLQSKSDSRWDTSGRAGVGGFSIPTECQIELDRLKAKYGEPPEDLEWGYEKD